MSNYKTSIIVCCLLLFAHVSAHDSVVNLTVWVHGTHLSQRFVANKYSPLHDRAYIRQGLTLAKNLPEKYDFAQIARTCCQHDPIEYDLNHFYTFGWRSGNIFAYHRRNVGKQLYAELEKLIKEHQDDGKQVRLRLVGFSHGGNVVLNCIRHFEQKNGIEIEGEFNSPVQH